MNLLYRWITAALLACVAASRAPAEGAAPGKYAAANGRTVDPTTLHGKLLMGYQGWFSCAGDGSELNRWNHWTPNGALPTPENIRVAMWPDLSEYEPDELYATGLNHSDGSPYGVYSAWNLKTVMRHFRWMRDYNLDGAMPYRFMSRVPTHPEVRAFYDRVLGNIRQAAEAYGRVFALQYDISDYRGGSIVADIEKDWMSLVDDLKVTSSPAYLHHRGKPLLVLRNFGMAGGTRLITPAEAGELISWLKSGAPEKYRVTLMGALPGYWRSQGGDVKPDNGWPAVFRSFDVISAWPVGRFRDEAGADRWSHEIIEADLRECTRLHIDYMPAIYPGYSFHNADPAKRYNDKPRMAGRFYWRQVRNVVAAGAVMIYGGLFDEVDEATAIYKVAATAEDLPVVGQNKRFVTLDADGERLPSDWYLKLADYAGRALRREIPLSAERPIAP